MGDISLGAIGAGLLAAIVSLVGLVVGKDLKVSEFRQSWIDSLRENVSDFSTSMTSINNLIRTNQNKASNPSFVEAYDKANKAALMIRLRLNRGDPADQKILDIISEAENLSRSNAALTSDAFANLERRLVTASQDMLKTEWTRVKRGEPFYWRMKQAIIGLILLVAIIFVVASLMSLLKTKVPPQTSTPKDVLNSPVSATPANVSQSVFVGCQPSPAEGDPKAVQPILARTRTQVVRRAPRQRQADRTSQTCSK